MDTEIIYHYFSEKNLSEILQKKGLVLWFTRFDCLNDYTEGKEATRIQIKICDRLKKNYPDQKWIFDELIKIKPNFKKVILPDKIYGKTKCNVDKDDDMVKASTSINAYKVKTLPYICCFSKEMDSLPMWRSYSKDDMNAGQNIGVENYELTAELLNEENMAICNPTRHLNYCSVIYDDEKELIIKRAILNILKKIKSKNQRDEFEKELINYQNDLNDWSLSFKNKSFEYEKEVRLICYCAEEKIEDQNFNECFIKHRYEHKIQKTYLTLLLPLKYKLKKMFIGPFGKNKMEVIKTYLEDLDYKNVEIENSNIPIRF